MGYTTEFYGEITIEPPLSMAEGAYLNKFSSTRRMDRKKGPYYVEGSGYESGNDQDVLDHNNPPRGQPGLWCQWVPNENGDAIGWDGGEKFYYATEWMKYLIDHFVGDKPMAKQLEPDDFKFLTGHNLRGIIKAEGEEQGDVWYLAVANNVVKEFTSKTEANKFLKDNPNTFEDANNVIKNLQEPVSDKDKKIAKHKKML